MSATRAILAAVRTPDPEGDASDADLLRRFADARDEAAFEALVRRHARLVWGVCRRVLANAQDAEDAFQEAFLVLARNPDKPRRSGTAAGFLFGVARRVSLKARARAAGRADRSPRPGGTARPPEPDTDAAVRELQVILDEEIGRLPEAYRAPFLLCVLAGRSRAEAAAELGLNSGTLSGRLARARLLLRDRLAKRGVQLAAALALADLAATASAAPPGLVRATVAGATGAALAGGLLRAPLVLGAAAVLILGVAVAVGLAGGDPPRPNDPPAKKPAAEALAGADARGEVLPPGAVARFGATRWRHEGNAGAMAFAPDGATLAVVCRNDGHVYLFATATGTVLDRLAVPDGARLLDALAFSPGATALAAQDRDCSVHLWDTRTRKLTRSLRLPDGFSFGGHEKSIRFSPDGKFLAAASAVQVGGAVNVAERVVVWDVARGTPAVQIEKAGLGNPPLAFSPDGKTVALGTALDPAVQLWDVDTGKFLRGFTPDGPRPGAVVFSPDGKILASCVGERVFLSDPASGKELGRLEAKDVALRDVAFTPDGSTLVTASDDGKVRVWDVATRKERFVLDGPGREDLTVALSADGRTVATGTRRALIRVWDVRTGKARFPETDGHDAPVHAVAFSPDGRRVATGGEDGRVRLWDAAAGREVRRLDGTDGWGVSFSPDGRRLAAASGWGDSARVWDLGREADPITLRHPGAGIVRGAGFAPDGKTVFTAGWTAPAGGAHSKKGSATLRLWDPATGKLARELAMPEIVPNAVAASADGRRVAVAGYSDSPLRLWDLGRGHERRLWAGPGEDVLAAAFSPDGRVLVAGGDDRQPRLFEAETGKEVLRLGRHERWVSAVAFAPGGRMLVTADGGWQGAPERGEGPLTIRFWDVATGRELARLGGHASGVTSLAFSPDGKRLVAGLWNGTALVWAVPPEARPADRGGAKPGRKELDALWADLAGDDARKAYAAVWALAGSPDQSVPFLASSLRPAGKLDATKARQQIADLGDDDFAVREKASRELAAWGEDVESELREALPGRPSPEAVRRIEVLLTALHNSPPPDRRRELRGAWVLELIGTPTAAEVLTGLAKGDPAARLTREAKAALGRR